MHWGELDPNIDERAEVALLTRNIVIQGDESSDTDGFGGHFIVNAGFAAAHIEGVEFFRMAQKGILGKYPIHFHMCNNVTPKNARVIHNSVHGSYQRCVGEYLHGILIITTYPLGGSDSCNRWTDSAGQCVLWLHRSCLLLYATLSLFSVTE
jgi:hypothetical protein